MPRLDVIQKGGRRSQAGGRSRTRATADANQNEAPIRITEKQHAALVEYLRARFDAHNAMRKQRVERFRLIDQEVNGYLQRDNEDAERVRDNKGGKGIKPVDEKLPLTFAQLDECLTYMSQVLAPDEGLYGAIAPVEQQPVAKGFARMMNMHAERYGHYLALMRMIFDGLKYNEGGVAIDWRSIVGNRIRRGPGGAQIERTTLFSGNCLTALDPYNTIYDTSCPIEKVALEGEFFVQFDIVPPFRVRKAESDGKLSNADEIIERAGNATYKYYEQRPVIGDQAQQDSLTDWWQVFTMGAMSAGQHDMGALERATCHCWINPRQFGLSRDDGLQVWRFTMFEGELVKQATHMENAHGELPIAGCRPLDDGFGPQTRSFAELLTPLNRFASFQVNLHQRAKRKELVGGLTIYNSTVLPELGNEDVDMSGGKVPATISGQDIDLRKHLVQFSDSPDTSDTANNIQLVGELMQLILPTQAAQQVANLDRATQYQAAATVQGSNRRNLRYAKVINFQAMDVIRRQQMYNIFQWAEAIEYIDDESGELTEVDPTEFTDANLEFQIADGLRGIDTLSLIMHTKETLNSLLQSQRAGDVDIVKVLNYISTLWGDDTDWAQFRIKSPLDGLDPQSKQLAFELLQQHIAQRQQGAGAGEGQTAQEGAPA